MSSYLLLMMGGSGTRFGADIPKQFVKVSDKPIFSYIVEKYEKSKLLDGMVIVCHSDWVDYTNCWVSDLQLNIPFEVVAGGSCRSESVKNGLAAVSRYAKDNDVVLIHDATHPYVVKMAFRPSFRLRNSLAVPLLANASMTPFIAWIPKPA